MKVKELLAKLKEVDPELEVMGTYDGGCGQGPLCDAEYRARESGPHVYRDEGFWIDIDC